MHATLRTRQTVLYSTAEELITCFSGLQGATTQPSTFEVVGIEEREREMLCFFFPTSAWLQAGVPLL
jgi:hypothetical protein